MGIRGRLGERRENRSDGPNGREAGHRVTAHVPDVGRQRRGSCSLAPATHRRELGTIQRDDGSTQVTLNGWPLYYFAADAAPGDANGEGVAGAWFVARPDGRTPSSQPSTDEDSYNY